jgi:rod shape determining protein RodA
LLSIDRRSLQNFDWLLLTLMLLLLGIGLVNLFSATQAGTEGGLPAEFRRQLAALGLASIGMIAALLVDYRRIERLAIPFYLATLLLCASTLIFAPEVRGSRSWLLWGPLSFQPAELAKVGLVIALARYFQRNPAAEIRRLRDLLVPGMIAAAPAGIIAAQGDMGVAVLTVLIAATFLLFVRIPTRPGWWSRRRDRSPGGSEFAFQTTSDRILQVLDPSRDPLALATSPSNPRSRSAPDCLASPTWKEPRPSSSSFPPSTPTSSSRCSERVDSSAVQRCSASTSA